jgi:hypothetical protein
MNWTLWLHRPSAQFTPTIPAGPGELAHKNYTRDLIEFSVPRSTATASPPSPSDANDLWHGTIQRVEISEHPAGGDIRSRWAVKPMLGTMGCVHQGGVRVGPDREVRRVVAG